MHSPKHTKKQMFFPRKRGYLFLFIFLLVSVFSSLNFANALTIEDLRFGAKEDGKTRLVIDLDKTSDFRTFTLSDPYRIVIDLSAFSWNAGQFSPRPWANVKALRHGLLTPDISRIVLDMDKAIEIKTAFTLPNPARLVIDYKTIPPATYARISAKTFGTLTVENTKAPRAVTTPVSPPAHTTIGREIEALVQSLNFHPNGIPIPRAKPKDLAAQARARYAQNTPDYTPPPRQRRKPLIVIDPGHGGVDPGAVGHGNSYEKHAVLALAKDLRKQLLKTGKYRVVMTRERDIFIKLSQRRKFAHDKGADLFISIHADSIEKPHIRGASFYTLSNKASDAQTAKLAAKENRADLIAGVDLSHEDDEVTDILLDLAMRDTMNHSRFFAGKLVDAFNRNGIKTLQRPHRYAGFAVLKNADVPSVLIEAGFMSNKKEAKLLNTNSYRKKLASAIKRGVDAYFMQVERNGV
jgi:N-acetylmuramoyl-L-alanine amidase